MARRPHRRRMRLGLPVLTVLALAFIVARSPPIRLVPAPSGNSYESAAQGDWRTVRRVVDGDTLVLENGERVRLIGVDTPETVHPQKPVERFGKQASAFTRRLLEGQRVRLKFDQQRRDRYGRTLAYVYLPDGQLVNEEIIRQGYGHAFTKCPFAQDMMDHFRAAERQAREAGRGLWAP